VRLRRGAPLALLLGAAVALRLLAAVGCELNDPDRDVKRLFPGATSFKTEYVSLQRAGGEALLRRVEAKLGDKFQGLYETIDVSYTMYRIYKGTDLIGYIHGVNQKGRYGGIQVFLALDLKGAIQAFYFQKLTNQAAGQLRDPAFGRQFVGLTLADFEAYNPAAGTVAPGSRLAAVKNPAPSAEDDFKAALRGAKKNLILCDVFLYGGANIKEIA
jgi:hypothetical protein